LICNDMGVCVGCNAAADCAVPAPAAGTIPTEATVAANGAAAFLTTLPCGPDGRPLADAASPAQTPAGPGTTSGTGADIPPSTIAGQTTPPEVSR
jgi:hypothetical protein